MGPINRIRQRLKTWWHDADLTVEELNQLVFTSLMVQLGIQSLQLRRGTYD